MKSQTTLIIDPRDQHKTKVTLIHNGQSFSKSSLASSLHSQVILPFIDSLVHEANCSLQDIQEIQVCVDSGSFTGRRVGVVIGQTLGMLLYIPVNGQDASKPITITYEKDKWS